MSKREVLGMTRSKAFMNREACSQRKNACDDASIDNHSRSPDIVYVGGHL